MLSSLFVLPAPTTYLTALALRIDSISTRLGRTTQGARKSSVEQQKRKSGRDDRSIFGPFGVNGYRFTDFPQGACVIDIGCGLGKQLRELESQGCHAIGADLDPDRAKAIRALGFPVVIARAEQLPFRHGVADGVICRLVLPYTNEALAIAECARLLKPGGRIEACYHGVGFYLLCIFLGTSREYRMFGVRAILNSWFYVLTAGRSPRRFGDLYQSRSRRGTINWCVNK